MSIKETGAFRIRSISEAVLVWIWDEIEEKNTHRGQLLDLNITLRAHSAVKLEGTFLDKGAQLYTIHAVRGPKANTLVPKIERMGPFSRYGLIGVKINWNREPSEQHKETALEVLQKAGYQVPPYGLKRYRATFESIITVNGTVIIDSESEEAARVFAEEVMSQYRSGASSRTHNISWRYSEPKEYGKELKLLNIEPE